LYPVAKTTSDGVDLVAPGAVLVLQKENLVMNKVYLQGTTKSSPVPNVYEQAAIRQTGVLGALTGINSFLSALGGIEAQSRTLGPGEKLWVTNISSQRDGIVFRLMSDPVNNMRYHATLRFPYADIVSVDSATALVAEVFVTDRPALALAPTPAAPRAAATALPSSKLLDSDGMFRLANVLAERGDNVEAVRWLRKASDSGHVKATNALGFMYEEGRGVPQNYDHASRLYLKAMKRGDPDAMMNRGMMVAKGRGVKTDLAQAYMHFLLAAAYAKDDDTRDAAVKVKEEIASKLSPQQLAQGQASADRFAKTEIK
jgi:hypothetical protein